MRPRLPLLTLLLMVPVALQAQAPDAPRRWDRGLREMADALLRRHLPAPSFSDTLFTLDSLSFGAGTVSPGIYAADPDRMPVGVPAPVDPEMAHPAPLLVPAMPGSDSLRIQVLYPEPMKKRND